MLKYFEAQLRNIKPSDGNALGNATREQVLETIRSAAKVDPQRYSDPEAYLDRKIQEYKDHEGEKLVYFLAYTGEGREKKVSVERAWESEIADLANSWTAMTPAFVEASTLPRFTEKVMVHYE